MNQALLVIMDANCQVFKLLLILTGSLCLCFSSMSSPPSHTLKKKLKVRNVNRRQVLLLLSLFESTLLKIRLCRAPNRARSRLVEMREYHSRGLIRTNAAQLASSVNNASWTLISCWTSLYGLKCNSDELRRSFRWNFFPLPRTSAPWSLLEWYLAITWRLFQHVLFAAIKPV